jgi:aminoglycoside phosphotransferase (APT) family kinase protein
MTTTDTPPGIRYDSVARFFAQHVPGAEGPLSFQLIGDGRSNLTYKVVCGGNTWVMRRPPLGHVIATAHDMVREYRVLEGVSKVGFPAPRPIALCEDPEVNDFPFYVMEYRDGVIIVNDIPAGYADRPEQRRAMSMALVNTMIELHAIDYNAVGLGDFGRPDGYLERQVRRWLKQWEQNKTRELPLIDELIRRLERALPVSPPGTIVHGDYRLGNMILDPHDPGKVVAVLDWEMSTLGDPLSDLGYTLVYWGSPGDDPGRTNARPTSQVTAQPGFMTRTEIVDEYARRTGRDVSHIDYYEVFANYKLAVITEGIYKRHLQGQTVGAGYGGMADSCVRLVELALSQADASSDPKLRGE